MGFLRWLFILAICCGHTGVAMADPPPASAGSLSLIVMDPLAAPLSCPCVEGYAQRDYEKLARYLSERLGRSVQITFAQSFENALAQENCSTIDIAIGKDSVVRHDARAKKIKLRPIAQLTGADGSTTQTGMIVVRSADPAQSAADLAGYRVLFGTAECDEKHAAVRKLLASAGIEPPPSAAVETTESCSDGACKIIEWGENERAAAVISSYAAPLLEGCGTIQKGELRVVGESEPVPFITAFVSDRIDKKLRSAIRRALLDVGDDQELTKSLEALLGFVPIDETYHELRQSFAAKKARGFEERRAAVEESKSPPAGTSAQPEEQPTSSWPGWRGPGRDGRVPYLPQTLPSGAEIVWRQPLQRAGLGGIAATDQFVLLGDRDISNTFDEFRCYSAATGELQWTVQYAAPGKLDYDNTPRATPLVHEDSVYLLGAFGHLTCADLPSGLVLWQKNLIEEFGGDPRLVWGLCSSPLLVDNKLIVNPGGPQASVVALDPASGEVLWAAPGERHAYSSFIVATLGGLRQLVGFDETSMGGWDVETGRRLWTLKPPHTGDFNVPTPAVFNGQLLVTSENNGTRLYAFNAQGQIILQPVASYDRLAPDTSSPVVVGERAFCVCIDMYCLDLADGLRPIWIGEDKAFCDYSPLLATEDRVLAIGHGGELILLDAKSDEFRIISRLELFPEDASRAEVLAHPALVGSRLYIRGERELICVELGNSAEIGN